jgi:hypothetical protein
MSWSTIERVSSYFVFDPLRLAIISESAKLAAPSTLHQLAPQPIIFTIAPMCREKVAGSSASLHLLLTEG